MNSFAFLMVQKRRRPAKLAIRPASAAHAAPAGCGYPVRLTRSNVTPGRDKADKTVRDFRRRRYYRGNPMNLKNWESTIKQIADESNQEPKEASRHRPFTAWTP